MSRSLLTAEYRPRWRRAKSLTLLLCLAAKITFAQAPGPLPKPPAEKLAVLDRFAGTWDVTITTRRPKPAVVTYMFTYAWVLDHRYLQGDTGIKSDGTQDLVIFTYEQASNGYPLWIFYSSGAWIYLPPGVWDESSRTMTWKSAPTLTVSYLNRCSFQDAKTQRCTVLVKDWRGTVLLEQDSVALRRAP